MQAESGKQCRRTAVSEKVCRLAVCAHARGTATAMWLLNIFKKVLDTKVGK